MLVPRARFRPDTVLDTEVSGVSSSGGPGGQRGERACKRPAHLPLAYGCASETNGCAERAIQALKEQLLWIERFETFEQLRAAVRAFGRLYNAEWLLERHGYRTPIEAREHLLGVAAEAQIA